ncbi:putative ABC transport system ATP-binding protein [Gracilibacillus halotolerans]|uniref:Putative ABC transport system ATP-binding protein n=2 Tax=Gracilibacillus halotolerans TaxID=74386 RepID=A0A841RLN1_9BACI|nr:putative ABC transport system ATP-binding protein [Gracilibacillus halotolerans]
MKVLNSVHLQIKQGEFAVIMGPSGSGKSTLMNILGCLDRPTSGDYWLNNKVVSSYEEKELANVRNRSFGFVFQQFHLLPRLTAFQNVALPMIYAGLPKDERSKRAIAALKKVGLADHINYFPNELSGGQKQRVAIARSIVNQPQIILADEPTGSLDTTTSRQIMDLFSMLHGEGTTIILVTHEMWISKYADKKIFVRDGIVTGSEYKGEIST